MEASGGIIPAPATKVDWGSITGHGMHTSLRATPTMRAALHGVSRWWWRTAYGNAPGGVGDATSGSRVSLCEITT